MEQLLNRLIFGLTLGCLLSMTAVGNANGPTVMEIAVVVQSQNSVNMPKNYSSPMIHGNAPVPRIDPLDLPLSDYALHPEFNGDLRDAGSSGQKTLPEQSGPVLNRGSAELPPLRVLIFILTSRTRGASGPDSPGGISGRHKLIIDVNVGETFQQPAPVAGQLPRAVHIAAAPYENKELSSAKGLSHVAPEPRRDVGDGRAFDLSTTMSLQTLPVFGIAQPLPDH